MTGETMGLTRFATTRGLKTMFDVRSHIHAGLRCAPTSKRYRKWYESETQRLLAASAETDRLYAEAVQRGEIVPPTKPTLEDIAAGDPDRADTQAAIRVLAKRAARAKELGL